MKYFLIFLILVGFGLSIVYAQYQGDVEFYHLPITLESKQYSILAQSSVNEFTNVMYDNKAKSIILSISSPNDLIGIAAITLNQQTISDLLNNSDPNNILLLINGEEQAYKTTTQGNIISLLFYIPSMSTEIELISSTEKFSKGDFKLEDIPTTIPRIYPPLKQYHVGVPGQNIMCNEDLFLVHKYDGTPACVKPETKQKLIQRGWTGFILPSIGSTTKTEKHVEISLIGFVHGQLVNEPISDFIIKLEGFGYNYHEPELMIKTDEDKIIWTNEDFSSLHFQRTMPGYFCKEYSFNEIGGPVIINQTGYHYFFITFEGQQLTQGFSVREEMASGGNIPSYGIHCETPLPKNETVE